jgi:hypothetical protein
MNKEKLYDEEIAPKLLELCKLAQKHGMSFVACVEYDPTNAGYGRTEWQAPDEGGKLSAAQRLVHWAARSEGNIDRLMMAVDRHGREHGHSSIYLQMAGNKNVKYTGNEVAAITVTSPNS